MNEHEALHAASMAIARLDERLRTDGFAEALSTWNLTQEAIGIAAWEGLCVREADLVAMLCGGDALYDKSIRAAQGIHAALSRAHGWSGLGSPAPEAIVDCLRRSDEMNVTRAGRQDDGVVDNDAFNLSNSLNGIGSHDPWTAAAYLRNVLDRPSEFKGRSRRVAFMVNPWLLSNGFGVAMGAVPAMAQALYKAHDWAGAQDAVDDDAGWAARYFAGVAAGARRSYGALCAFERLAGEAGARLGRKRADSKFAPVLKAFLGQPIHSITDLAERFDVTHQGATFVVKSLVEAGVVSAYEGGHGKGRLFVMRKGLGLG